MLWDVFDFITMGVFEKKTQAKNDWASDESQNRNASGSNTTYSNWSPYPNDTKDGASSNDNYKNESDHQRGTALGNNGLLQGSGFNTHGLLTSQKLYDTKQESKSKPKAQNKQENKPAPPQQKKDEAPKPVVAPPQPASNKVETSVKKEEPKPQAQKPTDSKKDQNKKEEDSKSDDLSKKIQKEKEALEAVKQRE